MAELKIDHGTLFPAPVIVAAAVIGICTIFLFPIGLIITLVCSYVGFSRKGVRFNKERNWFQTYTSAFGILKFGQKWNVDIYQYVTIRPAKETISGTSRSNVSASSTTYFFQVLLFNTEKKGKQVIHKIPSLVDAEKWAKELCHEYNFEYIEYTPAKRRRR